MIRFVLIQLLTVITIFGFSLPTFARQVILTWTPPTNNTDGTLISAEKRADLRYRIFYGPVSRTYGAPIEVSNPLPASGGMLTTTLTLTDPETINLYFAMKAYYFTSRAESDFTNEAIQAGKVKLLPPGVPEIVGSLNDESIYPEYLVLAFPDNNGNYVVPTETDLYNQLVEKHPELSTGELVIHYKRNI